MEKCMICYTDQEHMDEHWAFESMDVTLNSPANRLRIAAFYREAKRRDKVHVFWDVYRRKRAAKLTWDTVTQAKWRTIESRRPGKGKHHDSWSIREKYARCN